MSDTFPTELTDRQVAAPFLDTAAMLDELNELAHGLDDDGNETPEADPSGAGAGASGAGAAPEGEDGDGAGDPPVDPPVTVPPGFMEFEGQLWPIEEVKALLELNRRMKEQPELAQRVTQAITPSTEPAALPDWVDPEDPRTVAMYRELEAVRQSNAQAMAQISQRTEADRRSHVVDCFRSAIGNFKTAHPNLSDAQVAQVADLAGRANIIEGLERSEGSLTAAFEKGMDMTMWSTPSLRSLVLAEQAASVAANGKDRQRKQAALNSGGGSTQRTNGAPRKPATRDEMMAAALEDIRAGMQD